MGGSSVQCSLVTGNTDLSALSPAQNVTAPMGYKCQIGKNLIIPRVFRDISASLIQWILCIGYQIELHLKLKLKTTKYLYICILTLRPILTCDGPWWSGTRGKRLPHPPWSGPTSAGLRPLTRTLIHSASDSSRRLCSMIALTEIFSHKKKIVECRW